MAIFAPNLGASSTFVGLPGLESPDGPSRPSDQPGASLPMEEVTDAFLASSLH